MKSPAPINAKMLMTTILSVVMSYAVATFGALAGLLIVTFVLGWCAHAYLPSSSSDTTSTPDPTVAP